MRLDSFIARFFAWWLGELRACVPTPLRARLWPAPRLLSVECDQDHLRFELQRDGRFEHIGDVAFDAERPEAAAKPVRNLLRHAKLRGSDAILRLPESRVLQPVLDLPTATEENLREVLGFEMDRHTPFSADEVCYDYHVIGRDRERQRLTVKLLVAPKEVVERTFAAARACGLAPRRMTGPGDGDQGSRALNLLPQTAVTGGGRAIYRISAVMLLVASLLGATGLYLPLRQKQDALADLEKRLAQLQIEAREAHALEEKVQDLLVRGDFLLNEKRGQAAAVELLAEVTRLLPDDTWLLQFAWRNGSLRLSGYSKNPSSLIRLLEASDHLTEVRFGSPVTMDPRVGLERFNISASAAEQGTL